MTEKANHGLEIIKKETEARENYQTLQPEDNFTINDSFFSNENSEEVFAETKLKSRFDFEKGKWLRTRFYIGKLKQIFVELIITFLSSRNFRKELK